MVNSSVSADRRHRSRIFVYFERRCAFQTSTGEKQALFSLAMLSPRVRARPGLSVSLGVENANPHWTLPLIWGDGIELGHLVTSVNYPCMVAKLLAAALSSQVGTVTDEHRHVVFEQSLNCTCCHCRLGELGSKLYYKQSMILCARDYLRLFGLTGVCAACDKNIPAFELVMRAKSNVYHLQCFACHICNHRFCIGDKYYLCDNKILCQYDYEERMTFLQAAYNNQSFTEITKNIQQLEDFEPVPLYPSLSPPQCYQKRGLHAGEAADFPTEEYALVYDNAVRCMPDALDADITSAEVFRMDVYNSERHPLVKVSI
uniref:LIM zinc-binding domain-containing protein n=1 Tax=Ascaris lumbricoides TaxID=6252 RepID=A0A9J2P9N8_ASCLU